MEETNGMKILKFSAENVKGLKAVEISPNGDNVTISGPNGAGKTTILDSIERTLCGGQLALSKGADKGSVELDMGEYTVSRIITQKTDRLIVKNKDGAQYPSPRAFLEKVVGRLSIDPLAFIRLKGREQLDVIFRLNPNLKPALEEADARIAGIKEERSEILKDGKRLAVALEAAPFHEDAPEEPVSVVELTSELNEALEHNKGIDAVTKEVEEMEATLEKHKGDLRKLKDKLNLLQEETKRLEDEIGVREDVCAKGEEIIAGKKDGLGAVQTVDTTDITNRIADSEATNAKVRTNQNRARIQAEKDDAANEYSAKGAELKKAEKDRADLLGTANFPIDGLSVNGQGVTYNEVPMAEISTSEKVRVGASIAVAQKPSAKIILADDVSLLDEKNLGILHDICRDMQIWQVVNDTSGDVGFYIEEGELREAAGNEAA